MSDEKSKSGKVGWETEPSVRRKNETSVKHSKKERGMIIKPSQYLLGPLLGLFRSRRGRKVGAPSPRTGKLRREDRNLGRTCKQRSYSYISACFSFSSFFFAVLFESSFWLRLSNLICISNWLLYAPSATPCGIPRRFRSARRPKTPDPIRTARKTPRSRAWPPDRSNLQIYLSAEIAEGDFRDQDRYVGGGDGSSRRNGSRQSPPRRAQGK